MFWDRFFALCLANNTKPNPVAKEIGISSGNLTNWKNGVALPNVETLLKIANYFGCSAGYLLGETDDPAAQKKEPDLKVQLSPEEDKFVTLLRQASPEKRAAILALLE